MTGNIRKLSVISETQCKKVKCSFCFKFQYQIFLPKMTYIVNNTYLINIVDNWRRHLFYSNLYFVSIFRLFPVPVRYVASNIYVCN